MKKYISAFLIVGSILLPSIGWVFATVDPSLVPNWATTDFNSVINNVTAPVWTNTVLDGTNTPYVPPVSKPQTVIVTEKVPWASCTCDIGNKTDADCDGNIEGRRYVCTIPAGWLVGFQNLFAAIISVFIKITLLFGVLAIVALGIGYAIFSGGDEEKTKKIKNYAINLIIGMIILFFFRYILSFLAPWIFQ